MAGFGDSLMKKVASSRRSLKFAIKKDKNKGPTQEPLVPVSEVSAEEKKEAKEKEVVELEEIKEAYTLPEIPHTPLSGNAFADVLERPPVILPLAAILED